MKLFFDTEFTGLHQKTTLISIGIVSEDDRYFYYECIDYDKEQIDNWLKENIIANLKYKGILTSNNAQESGCISCCGTTYTCGQFLKIWLSDFNKIELWSDCLSYDWILLSELIADRKHGYPQLPSNFSYHSPYDILPLFKLAGKDPDINREKFLEWPDSIDKHNALWDARVIKACYYKLIDYIYPQEKGFKHDFQ